MGGALPGPLRAEADDAPRATDPRVEIVEADVADMPRLAEAMSGCEAAYYLIHSMEAAGRDYAQRHRKKGDQKKGHKHP